MSRRKQGNHIGLATHLGLGSLTGKTDVGIKSTVRQHYALREARCAGSIIDKGKFLGGIFVIVKVLGLESLWIEAFERRGKLLTRLHERLVACIQIAQVGHLHNYLYIGHLVLRQAFPYGIIYKEYLGL